MNTLYQVEQYLGGQWSAVHPPEEWHAAQDRAWSLAFAGPRQRYRISPATTPTADEPAADAQPEGGAP